LVNNWENGWIIKDQKSNLKDQNLIQIKIIYLPQYLEYLGFGILAIGIIAIFLYPASNKNSLL